MVWVCVESTLWTSPNARPERRTFDRSLSSGCDNDNASKASAAPPPLPPSGHLFWKPAATPTRSRPPRAGHTSDGGKQRSHARRGCIFHLASVADRSTTWPNIYLLNSIPSVLPLDLSIYSIMSQPHASKGFPLEPLYVLVAILVILVTFLLTRKLRKTSNIVVLVGLSESGKTTLFTRVVFNKPKKSVTSLTQNEATLDDLSLKLVDIPGAERLRPRFWDQYREKARNVVFVVDSTNVSSKLRNLGEYLYSLLSDSIIQKNRIGFSIACNKQDLPNALRRDEIKTILEKELTAIRETKKGQLSKTSEEETEDRLRKLSSREISLDELNVKMIETSSDNIDQLIKSIL